tara:strand:+ start:341 stop:2584 length:2244 start_codon:yes stop_codon:yes gene_type:complete
MFDKAINGSIINTLINRENAINREGSYKPLEPQNVSVRDAPMTDMLTRSIWARCTASVKDKDTSKLVRISSAFKNGKPINKPLASKVSLFTSDPSAKFRPHSGITSISTQFKNSYMQYISVNFTLWDPSDFNKYEAAFLKHGNTVMVEWGWSNCAAGGIKPNTGSDFTAILKQQTSEINSVGGEKCIATGLVKSFNWNIGPNGEYKCTVDLISMANNVFGAQVGKDDPNTDSKKKAEAQADAIKKANLRFKTFMEKLPAVIQQSQGGGFTYYNEAKKMGWCSWEWFENRLNTFFSQESGKSGLVLSKIDTGNQTCYNHANLCATSWHCMTGKVERVSEIEAVMNADNKGEPDDYKGYDQATKDEYKVVQEILGTLSGGVTPGLYKGFVFSATFLQENFGNEIDSLQNALQNFWNTVSGVYGGYISTEVVAHDTAPVISLKSRTTTPVPVASSGYTFKVYNKKSLMKDFSVNVKMDSKLVTQAMYHSNKGNTSLGDQSTNNPENIEAVATGLVMANENNPGDSGVLQDEVYDDIYSPMMRNLFVTGGGQYSNTGYSPNEKEWAALSPTGAGGEDDVKQHVKDLENLAANEALIADMLNEGLEYPEVDPEKPMLIWGLDGEVIEGIRIAMMSGLDNDNTGGAGGMVPIIPIGCSFTIAGIGGIRPFDIFNLSYLPDRYKQNVDFRVTSVSHDVSPTGWDTKIDANMRVNYKAVEGKKTSKHGDGKKYSAYDYAKAYADLEKQKKKTEGS